MVGAFAESKERYCASEQKPDWMLPANRPESEGVVQSSDPIKKMKSLRWYQWAPKPPLMPQGSLTFTQRRFRGFWQKPVPGLCLDSGLMYSYYTPPIVKGTGTLGRADTQEECESLTEDEVQYQPSRARTIVDIELGLVCAKCERPNSRRDRCPSDLQCLRWSPRISYAPYYL